MEATRVAYGMALAEYGSDERIIVLDADLSCCTMTEYFAKKYPERFLNCGIAEANMVGVSAGLATCGAVPFANSFAMFIAGRCYEQIRNSVAYPNLNVKLVGTHAGVSVGEDGATHQCLEDLGIMRVIPNMTVLSPCDSEETKQAVRAMIDHIGPVYLRLGRAPIANIPEADAIEFEIGKAKQIRSGDDITIAATGIMVGMAMEAAKLLQQEGVKARVLNFHTIKPLDESAIYRAVQETRGIVVAEEHNIKTGLGSAIAEYTSTQCPTTMRFVAVKDTFGRSGKAEELLEYFNLTSAAIVSAAQDILR